LWEATNLLTYLQEQQARAVNQKDWASFNRVTSLQTVAWGYIRIFAEQLVERGEVPVDLTERLRKNLGIARARDGELRTARARVSALLDDERRAA